MTTQTSTQRQKNTPVAEERELWMLAGLALVIHWFEELFALLNGPVLMLGMGIALVDLLTDGRLSASLPILLIAWGVSQAVGIDTQLLACWARVAKSWRHGRYLQMGGWLILGAVIGYAAWQAGYVFAIQQSQGISEGAALQELGLSAEVWLGWRMFLAVGLVALAGLTRYVPPSAKPALDTDAEEKRLRDELRLQPLREQLAQRKAGGMGGLVRGAFDGLRGGMPAHDAYQAPYSDGLAGDDAEGDGTPSSSVGATFNPYYPTGGGTPAAARPRHRAAAPSESVRAVALAPVAPKPRRASIRGGVDEKALRIAREDAIAVWLVAAWESSEPVVIRDLWRRLQREEHRRGLKGNASMSTVSGLVRVVRERLSARGVLFSEGKDGALTPVQIVEDESAPVAQ